LKTEDRIL